MSIYEKIKKQIASEVEEQNERQRRMNKQQKELAMNIAKQLAERGVLCRVEESGIVWDIVVALDDELPYLDNLQGLIRVFWKAHNDPSEIYNVKYLYSMYNRERFSDWRGTRDIDHIMAEIERDITHYQRRKHL